MNFRKAILFLIAAFLVTGLSFPATGKDPSRLHYPTPPQNENSLFYIQRSKNINAIVYDANVKADGTLDVEDPLKIYWIRYSSDSTTAPLTYIQQKFAYGVKAAPYPGKPGQYIITFNSYAKKQIYLVKKADGKHYGAFTMINGRYAELKKIFIQLNGGTFWFPNIEFIDIVGEEPATQKQLTEHFKPAR